MHHYESFINAAWEINDTPLPDQHADAIYQVMSDLNAGHIQIVQRSDAGDWKVNAWIKKAILLYFKLQKMQLMPDGSYDKVPLKCHDWTEADFQAAQFRLVPGAILRYGAYIGKDVVVMPSFINIGAHVGNNSLVDSWATIGSCAMIGKLCHISMHAGIGGVLEPLQANPVIIEDYCFIGAHSSVTEGAIIREGSVLAMGVRIGATTKIIDRETGKQWCGEVPPYSVVVPGSVPSADGLTHTDAAIIIKTVDAQTRKKTSINTLLRSYEPAE